MHSKKCLLFFSCIFVTVLGQGPGNSNNNTDVAKELVKKAFNTALRSASISPISSGGTDFTVSNMIAFKFPLITITEYRSGYGIKITNLGLYVYGRWTFLHMKGGFRVKAANVSIYLYYRKITKEIESCTVYLGTISVTFWIDPPVCKSCTTRDVEKQRSSFLKKLKRRVKAAICERLKYLLDGVL